MFLSQTTPGLEQRPAQHLAELVCVRYAKKNKLAISEYFWNLPQWKKMYGRQIGLANGLLKLFSIESILGALQSKAGDWIFSLSYKGLVDIIKQNEFELQRQEKKEAVPLTEYKTEIVTEVAQIKTGRSMRNILEDME